MAKALRETSLSLYTELNLSPNEIVQFSVDISGVHRVEYMEKQNMYMEKLEEDLTRYFKSLGEMKGRVTEVQDDMKEEYISQVENLENIRNIFLAKYGKFKKSSGVAWGDLKSRN